MSTAKPDSESNPKYSPTHLPESVKATLKGLSDYMRPIADGMRSVDVSIITAVSEATKYHHTQLQQTMESIASTVTRPPLIVDETIQSISASIINQVRSFSEIASPLSQYVQQVTKTLRVDIDWQRHEREYRDAYSRFVQIFTECGWPPLLKIPANSIHEFIREYDNDPVDFRGSIDDWVLKYHDESGLNDIEAGWESNSIIAERLPILRECIDGHRNEYYNLTVPTLLSQIEGILCSAFEHVGTSGGHVWRRYVDAIVENQTEYLPIREMIIERLLERFRWGDSSATNFSRHTILHGSSLLHGTKVSSMKLILLVDVIVHLINVHFRETTSDS
jgi:hypothetical protein